MPTLRELEADAQVECAREVGHNIKAFWNDPKYRLTRDFLINDLCRVHRLSSALPGADADWKNGRRWPGLVLEQLATAPMDDPVPPEPPARTMTEKARRRAAQSSTTT